MTNRQYDTGKRVTIIGITVNVLLTVIKLLAGFLAHSTAMIADGIESASDILTTSIVAYSIKIAQKPEDQKHPYGHEKAESIAAKFVAGFLLFSGLTIGWNAMQAIIQNNIETPGVFALYAAELTIVVKEILFWYTFITAKKIKSTALKANAWHFRSDALTSVGTLIGVAAARLGYPAADPIAAIITALLILRMAYRLYEKSISELMDSSAPKQKLDEIRHVISSVENVKGIDSLKTRIHGNMLYVDVDIVVDSTMSVSAGHDIANEVKNTLKLTFSDIKDVMVHVNPCNPDKSNVACQNCDKHCL